MKKFSNDTTQYIEKLEAENLNLQCCGNCKLYSDLFVHKKCKKRTYPYSPSDCCSNWQSDNLTTNERI